MRLRPTTGADEDFAALTRPRFSTFVAIGVFFLVAQIACVIVALLTLRTPDVEMTTGYGMAQAQEISADPGTVGSFLIDRARGDDHE
jgi:hypothetical protein